MTSSPDETNPPLIVNTDRVLSLPVAAQSLQVVARRRCQDSQFRCGMQFQQFSQRYPLAGTKPPGMLIVKKLLRFLRRKALNHPSSILCQTWNVKRVKIASHGTPRPRQNPPATPGAEFTPTVYVGATSASSNSSAAANTGWSKRWRADPSASSGQEPAATFGGETTVSSYAYA
jgi:hypothetical protein